MGAYSIPHRKDKQKNSMEKPNKKEYCFQIVLIGWKK
jgi:hypothetical protein